MSTTEVIPQRQLRNDVSGVLQRVALGRTYIITVRGKEVATLAPVNQPRYKRLRPAGDLRGIKRRSSTQLTSETLDALREERV
ncbi:MAG: type II toxin-antitoxin system prevent-host-death family antitoxin [Micrococcales bacterium]|nr:type II toxin-antitoxin system prevent-host-death family antitoxin [Micrococcales bacterium]